ncbi:MAG: PHP domain-containing protein [Dehalococcoidia bacterium]|nr:PHP domain-containing protein [Dehalococcoidia bacterium]
MLHVDLHSHTRFSFDSSMPPEVLVARCVSRGITCLAVTEHNNIDGARYVQQIAPFKVIVGEEIKTDQGEIIGLFLTEEVPRDLTPEETLDRIHRQGGLAAVPHPYDRFRGSRLTETALNKFAGQIDITEAFNCRTTLLRDSQRAEDYGRRRGHALGIGSDSHTPSEIGGAHIEMEDFDLRDPQEFLAKLRQGRLVGQRANPLVHVPTRLVKTMRSVKRLL